MRNRCWCLGILALLLTGCVSYGEAIRQAESDLFQRAPQRALASLESLDGSSRNRLLYLLNKGMVEHMAGDIDASISSFEAAKKFVEAFEASSISETTGRFTVAETIGVYAGEEFEKVMLHVYQALNHLARGDSDAARVEALQIDLLLRKSDPDNGMAKHGGDAFARYLSGIIFESRSEWSDALIAYRKAYQAYTSMSGGYGVPLPQDLKKRLLWLTRRLGANNENQKFREEFGIDDVSPAGALPEGKGEIVLVLSAGLAPAKREVSSVVQDPRSGKIFRISLPALQMRGSRVSSVIVTAENVGDVKAERVESISRAANRTLQSQLPGLTARALSRNVVKSAAANQIGKESEGLEYLVNFASAVFENADTRSWRILPHEIYLARMALEPGTYDVQLKLGGTGRAQSYDNVTVAAGGVTVLSEYWLSH